MRPVIWLRVRRLTELVATECCGALYSILKLRMTMTLCTVIAERG